MTIEGNESLDYGSRTLLLAIGRAQTADPAGKCARSGLPFNKGSGRAYLEKLGELGLLVSSARSVALTPEGWEAYRSLRAEADRAEEESRKPESIRARGVRVFQSRLDWVREELKGAEKRFQTDLENGRASGRGWYGALRDAERLIVAEAKLAAWTAAVTILAAGEDVVWPDDGTNPEDFRDVPAEERLDRVARMARTILLDAAGRQRWEIGHSEPFRKGAELAKLSGRCAAYAEILRLAEAAAERMREELANAAGS